MLPATRRLRPAERGQANTAASEAEPPCPDVARPGRRLASLVQNGRVSAIEPAAVLNGRYHVLRPVGRGGMGAVFEAIDLRLRNTVAVKKMTAEGAEARRAFEREGRLLAMLRHRALPVVIDYFIEDASCFLVMQFIEGEDLAALVRRKGACPDKDVQRWAT